MKKIHMVLAAFLVLLGIVAIISKSSSVSKEVQVFKLFKGYRTLTKTENENRTVASITDKNGKEMLAPPIAENPAETKTKYKQEDMLYNYSFTGRSDLISKNLTKVIEIETSKFQTPQKAKEMMKQRKDLYVELEKEKDSVVPLLINEFESIDKYDVRKKIPLYMILGRVANDESNSFLKARVLEPIFATSYEYKNDEFRMKNMAEAALINNAKRGLASAESALYEIAEKGDVGSKRLALTYFIFENKNKAKFEKFLDSKFTKEEFQKLVGKI